MLQQHAPMSHAFQTPSTGVSFNRRMQFLSMLLTLCVSQGRTYQISNLPELEFAIDISIFSDILELDDEDEQYFTRSLVYDFFVLARRTLDEMNSCL
jgi:osomolarity two-component system phosphorelay intermediate protein YPD1